MISISSLDSLRIAFKPAIQILRKRFTGKVPADEVEHIVLRFGKGLTRPYVARPGSYDHFKCCLDITNVELPEYRALYAFYFEGKWRNQKILQTLNDVEVFGSKVAWKLLDEYKNHQSNTVHMN